MRYMAETLLCFVSATAHLIDTSISPFGMIISQERLRGVADCVGLLGKEAVEHGGLPWGPGRLIRLSGAWGSPAGAPERQPHRLRAATRQTRRRYRRPWQGGSDARGCAVRSSRSGGSAGARTAGRGPH